MNHDQRVSFSLHMGDLFSRDQHVYEPVPLEPEEKDENPSAILSRAVASLENRSRGSFESLRDVEKDRVLRECVVTNTGWKQFDVTYKEVHVRVNYKLGFHQFLVMRDSWWTFDMRSVKYNSVNHNLYVVAERVCIEMVRRDVWGKNDYLWHYIQFFLGRVFYQRDHEAVLQWPETADDAAHHRVTRHMFRLAKAVTRRSSDAKIIKEIDQCSTWITDEMTRKDSKVRNRYQEYERVGLIWIKWSYLTQRGMTIALINFESDIGLEMIKSGDYKTAAECYLRAEQRAKMGHVILKYPQSFMIAFCYGQMGRLDLFDSYRQTIPMIEANHPIVLYYQCQHVVATRTPLEAAHINTGLLLTHEAVTFSHPYLIPILVNGLVTLGDMTTIVAWTTKAIDQKMLKEEMIRELQRARAFGSANKMRSAAGFVQTIKTAEQFVEQEAVLKTTDQFVERYAENKKKSYKKDEIKNVHQQQQSFVSESYFMVPRDDTVSDNLPLPAPELYVMKMIAPTLCDLKLC